MQAKSRYESSEPLYSLLLELCVCGSDISFHEPRRECNRFFSSCSSCSLTLLGSINISLALHRAWHYCRISVVRLPHSSVRGKLIISSYSVAVRYQSCETYSLHIVLCRIPTLYSSDTETEVECYLLASSGSSDCQT